MERYSVREFIAKTQQRELNQGLFELETERMLEVNLQEQIWAKAGSMISYIGDVKFTREGIFEHGIGKLFKKALTGEGTNLMKVSGRGKVYLADTGKKITILKLNNEKIVVSGNDLLAFEPSINWDIKLTRRVAGMMSGGLFEVHLDGTGLIAITSHYEPLTLLVTPDQPVFTDPNATVAWSGNLSPEIVTDVNFQTFIGRASGETFQMKFKGNGFVVVQPYEEVYYSHQKE